jgi:hypothetical protein
MMRVKNHQKLARVLPDMALILLKITSFTIFFFIVFFHEIIKNHANVSNTLTCLVMTLLLSEGGLTNENSLQNIVAYQ